MNIFFKNHSYVNTWKIGSIIGVLLFIFSHTVIGKNFPLQHFTTENGLPSNTVYCVYRDSKGFLWIGTDKGAAKYNGLEFERFTTNDGLADNEIMFFQEDNYGRLWMATYNGELCFYKNGVFHTWANTPFLKKSVSNSFIDWIALEKDSSITMKHRDKLSVVNIHGDRYTSFRLKDEKLPCTNILSVRKISENRYNITSEYLTFIIDTESNVIPNSIQSNNFLPYVFSQDKKYFFSENVICSVNNEMQLKFKNSLANSYVYSIYSDNNNWFIGTRNGLFINSDLQILQGNKVSDINQDVEGNYWISTLDNGLYCFDKNYSGIDQYNDAYTSKIIYAKAIGNYVFFTTDNSNLYRFENGKAVLLFDYYKNFGNHYNKTDWEFYVSRNTLGQDINDKYRYFNVEPNFSFAIDKINTNSPIVQTFENYRSYLCNNIKELDVSHDSIFFRNPDFVAVITLSKTKLHHSLIINRLGKESTSQICCMALAADNSLWYSNTDNVNKIVDSTNVPQQQFGNLIFKSMQIAGKNLVGITRTNQLVVCRDFENNHISIDSFTAGAHVVFDKLYKLNDTTFLIATNSLYRLLSLHAYGKPSVHIVENNSMPLDAEYICSNDSFCYFFKKRTITRVPVNDLFIQHQVPEIFFKTLKTRNKSYPIQPGTVISYDESKNISISFSPFSFGSKFIVCEYSVSKDSTDYWRPINNNEINLFDAGYGNYIVKVKARTLSGGFSPPYTFSFTISKPFWAKWWFFTLMGLCIACIIFYIIRINQKRVAREKNYLEKELNALRLQMNPHFLFNTLNSIYSLSKISSPKTPDVVHKLSEMLRFVTYKSGKQLSSISEEIKMIDTYIDLQMVRFEGRVIIQKDICLDEPDVMMVPLLLLPLIENAFKHGIGLRTDNSFIQINITLKQKMLRMVIRNSIVSESVKEKEYVGLGLANTRRQLALLYNEYELTTSDTNGIFVLELRINTNSYAGVKLSDRRG